MLQPLSKLHRVAFLLLLACSPLAARAADAPKPWVGTWRFANVDGHHVGEPFYLAFYGDGTMASWPVPEGWENVNGASWGKYTVKGNKLVLLLSPGAHPAAPFQVKNDQFIMTIEKTHRAVYQRVTKKLEPGWLENGKRAGSLKHPM